MEATSRQTIPRPDPRKASDLGTVAYLIDPAGRKLPAGHHSISLGSALEPPLGPAITDDAEPHLGLPGRSWVFHQRLLRAERQGPRLRAPALWAGGGI